MGDLTTLVQPPDDFSRMRDNAALRRSRAGKPSGEG